MGTIDILPTFAAITGQPLPKNKKIDGVDASALLKGKGNPPRTEFLHYTSRGDLEGIRQGKWKLLMKKRKQKGKWVDEMMLFDLASDLAESSNLSEENPKVVSRLTSRMLELDAEIETNARSPWYKE